MGIYGYGRTPVCHHPSAFMVILITINRAKCYAISPDNCKEDC